MASRSEAEQILERNASDGSPRLRQDKEERKERRGNWTALALLLITAAFLVYAAYVWHDTAYPVQANSTAPYTTVNNTVTQAPTPPANNPANNPPAQNPPADENTNSQ